MHLLLCCVTFPSRKMSFTTISCHCLTVAIHNLCQLELWHYRHNSVTLKVAALKHWNVKNALQIYFTWSVTVLPFSPSGCKLTGNQRDDTHFEGFNFHFLHSLCNMTESCFYIFTSTGNLNDPFNMLCYSREHAWWNGGCKCSTFSE